MKIKRLLAILIPGFIFAGVLTSVLAQPDAATADIFVVDVSFDDATTHDANPGDGVCADTFTLCPLRAAIEEANALSGWDTITFATAMTITLDTGEGNLPNITDQLTIDASSVWDATNNRPGVTLDGNQNTIGLALSADQSQIFGLYIHNSKNIGIQVLSSGNDIGGSGTGQRNVISGNGSSGIGISGAGAKNNTVSGNYIGVTPAGDAKEPNLLGVSIANGASNNLVGGVTAVDGNVIAGNTDYGVYIGGAGTNGNQLLSNTIGGSTALGNGKNGVYVHTNAGSTIIGGSGYGNTIAGNGADGILFFDITGMTLVQFNIIKENSQSGIMSWGDGLQVISNTIHNNTNSGIYIADTATGNTLSQNSIYDNGGQGIELASGGNGGLSAPVIITATQLGAMGTACASCWVEIFSDDADEGKIYEGTTIADGSGAWFYAGALVGRYATATAIDISAGNTSAFSAPKVVPITLFLPAILKP